MQREELKREETDEVISAIEQGASVLHLRGEPLVLKKDVLDEVEALREEWTVRSVPVREGWSLDRLIQKLIVQVGREFGILGQAWERIASLKVSVAGFGGGIDLQNQSGLLVEQLRTKVERYGARTPLVITVKQLDVLDEDPSHIEARLNELADTLPDAANVHFLTVGSYQFESLETVIEVTPFDKQHSVRFLRTHFPKLSPADAREVHERVNGYPLYLQLIAQTHDTGEDIDLSKISDDVFDHIEAYERTLDDEERRFLRRTSALTELDERTCTQVTSLDTMEAGDLLRSLNERLVLRNLGRRDGLQRYTMRDPFQNYFHKHEPEIDEIHRELFQHYAMEAVNALNEENKWLSQSLAPTSLCTVHLAAAYGGELTVEDAQDEIDGLDLNPDDRLQFAIGCVPQIASQLDDVTGLQYKEVDRVRQQLEAQDEVAVEQLVTVDYTRAFIRLIVRKQLDTAGRSEMLLEEATDIAEDALESIVVEKYGPEGEAPDDADIGNLEISGYLLTAYGHREQGNKQEMRRYLDKPLTVLENIGIPKSTAISVFRRGQTLWEKLHLQTELGDALSSNFDQVMETAQENESVKETLLEAQANIDNALGQTILEILQTLHERPYEVQMFVEDVGRILSNDRAVVRVADDYVIPCSVIWYQLAISLQLYNPLEFRKYRRIHQLLDRDTS